MATNVHDEEPELTAMSNILAALKPLEEDAQVRVVQWVVGKLGIASVRAAAPKPTTQSEVTEQEIEGALAKGDAPEFSDFADLCSAASPTSGPESALVAGYWFQICEGRESFGSQECNAELKHFGSPVGNITRAFDALIQQNPRLAMQVRKGGNTRQARKKYRLTHHGIEAVKRMLNG